MKIHSFLSVNRFGSEQIVGITARARQTPLGIWELVDSTFSADGLLRTSERKQAILILSDELKASTIFSYDMKQNNSKSLSAAESSRAASQRFSRLHDKQAAGIPLTNSEEAFLDEFTSILAATATEEPEDCGAN